MRRSCTVVKQGELIKHPVSNSFGPLSRPRLRLIVLRPDALEWHKGVATGKPEGSLPITGETTLRVDSTQLRVSTPGRQSPSVLLLEIEGGSGWATLREWAPVVQCSEATELGCHSWGDELGSFGGIQQDRAGL